MTHAARQLPSWLTFNVRQKMKSPKDTPGANLPDRWILRFILGFAVAGSVAFAGALLWSTRPMAVLVDAFALAAVIGLFGGAVSSFGKKALAYVLAFAREVISNP